MTHLRKTIGRAMFVLLTTAALAAANTTTPLPGTVNYVLGQATLNGESLSQSFAGSVAVQTNQLLDTGQGKVELLLTPGVFLRLGPDGELRMVSPDAPSVAFEVVKGEAILEAAQLFKGVRLSVLMDGSTTNITKPGLYVFDADRRGIGVLAGEAVVYQGNAHVTLKIGHGLLVFAGQPLKSRKLDMAVMENDPLFIWSRQRSGFQAMANVQADQAILAGPGDYDGEWYWDVALDCYAFLPLDGIVWSPFGWGFSAPVVVKKAPNPIHYPIPIVRGPKGPALLASVSRATSASAHSGGRSISSHTGGGGGGHIGGGGGGGGGRR